MVAFTIFIFTVLTIIIFSIHIMPFIFMKNGQFYEKWMSVRERNINLVPEAVT